MRRALFTLLVLLVSLPLIACDGTEDPKPDEFESVQSEKQRLMAPVVPQEEATQLASDNTAFAIDLYKEVLVDGENLFFSPHSISIALAMTYAGARGETAAEMAHALHFNLGDDALHNAFNALDLELESRGQGAENSEGQPFELSIANAIWGQDGFPFEMDFLDTLALNYGAGMRILNFMEEAESARLTINAWVAEQTKDRIPELIPGGVITEETRLVLTNAVYFNAAWLTQFEEDATTQDPFTLLDGAEVNVDMMHEQTTYGFFDGEGYLAVELPYDGDEVSMIALLPDGALADLEANLDTALLDTLLAGLEDKEVNLSFPKFTFETDLPLNDALQALGMVQAFLGGQADFSGMNTTTSLYIQAVLHKAFVEVKESGTEAAAATAVVVGEYTSAPVDPVEEAHFNRPFMFMIRDQATGAVLFVGRVMDPRG